MPADGSVNEVAGDWTTAAMIQQERSHSTEVERYVSAKEWRAGGMSYSVMISQRRWID